jgi:hypothetical protein
MPTSPPNKHVRCRLCAYVFPGWFPIPNVPDGAILLHHLADFHRTELTPNLRRMMIEDIGPVAMELFERVSGDDGGAQA